MRSLLKYLLLLVIPCRGQKISISYRVIAVTTTFNKFSEETKYKTSQKKKVEGSVFSVGNGYDLIPLGNSELANSRRKVALYARLEVDPNFMKTRIEEKLRTASSLANLPLMVGGLVLYPSGCQVEKGKVNAHFTIIACVQGTRLIKIYHKLEKISKPWREKRYALLPYQELFRAEGLGVARFILKPSDRDLYLGLESSGALVQLTSVEGPKPTWKWEHIMRGGNVPFNIFFPSSKSVSTEDGTCINGSPAVIFTEPKRLTGDMKTTVQLGALKRPSRSEWVDEAISAVDKAISAVDKAISYVGSNGALNYQGPCNNQASADRGVEVGFDDDDRDWKPRVRTDNREGAFVRPKGVWQRAGYWALGKDGRYRRTMRRPPTKTEKQTPKTLISPDANVPSSVNVLK